MASKKKKNEFIEKQIKIKQQFADKVYKKMRADRYGLTFCCPNELLDTDIKNYTCNWQNIKYEPMPEEYKRTYSTDPIPNYCPIGTFNNVTGLCDAEAEQIYVPSVGYSFADSIPNGIGVPAQASNLPWFGIDTPIIFTSVPSGSFGEGNGAAYIFQTWWTSYNATATGPLDQQVNPDVTQVSFVNALGKNPTSGWDPNIDYTYAVPIQLATSATIFIAVAALEAFRIETVTAGVSTTLVEFSVPTTLIQEISNAYLNDGGTGFLPTYANLNIAQISDNDVRSLGATTAGFEEAVNASRFWIYPVTLDAGCHVVRISAKNGDTKGMLAAAIYNNTYAEMTSAISRLQLNELWSSEQMAQLYTEIDSDNPWTCQAPYSLYTASPYSATCPGCRQQTGISVLACPEGYTWNETTEMCEGTFSSCDTETLKFEVVNQNGDAISDYDVVFDGGSYTTDNEGKFTIVIEQASINTEHMLNMCHCITTAGGCAVQNIKITVTDPDITTCTYNDPICKCQAPALYEHQVLYPTSGAQDLVLTFQDLNLSNTANTIESYVLEYRQYTEAGDGDWTSATITKPSSGTIFQFTLTGLAALTTYEYRIKTKCTDSESSYSAIYDWVSTDIQADEDLVLWYDFTDTTSMFTDLAGTTNVANNGDSVRRVNNKSQSTKKLGIFARDLVGSGLGWNKIDYTQSPKYDTSGANGLSFLRQYTFSGGGSIEKNEILPLISKATAGYGGVVDGVRLSDLNNMSSQALTTIMVVGYTSQFIANAITGAVTLVEWGGIYGQSSLNGAADFQPVDMYRNGGPSNPRPNHVMFDGGAGLSSGNIEPASVAGVDILIKRNSSVDSENAFGRNTFSPADTTAYNTINQPGAPPAWTVDFTQNSATKVFIGGNPWELVNMGSANEGNILPIYEYMVWNKTLTDSELNAILSVLKAKYAII